MAGVLIDTSVWVDMLREADSPVKAVVSVLLELDQALLCGAVKAELLQGQSRGQDAALARLFHNVPSAPTLEDDFFRAGQISRDLLRAGQRPSLGDMLVAAMALRLDAEVYSLDKVFAKVPGLKLYEA